MDRKRTSIPLSRVDSTPKNRMLQSFRSKNSYLKVNDQTESRGSNSRQGSVLRKDSTNSHMHSLKHASQLELTNELTGEIPDSIGEAAFLSSTSYSPGKLVLIRVKIQMITMTDVIQKEIVKAMPRFSSSLF